MKHQLELNPVGLFSFIGSVSMAAAANSLASAQLVGIHTTEDGHCVFTCRDAEGKEHQFSVSMFDDKTERMLDRVGVLEYACVHGKAAAAQLLKDAGAFRYRQPWENYNDLLYLLTDGKEGLPMEAEEE